MKKPVNSALIAMKRHSVKFFRWKTFMMFNRQGKVSAKVGMEWRVFIRCRTAYLREYMLVRALLFAMIMVCSGQCFAQDTFHVAKKKRPVVAVLPLAEWDSTNRDSIISYTVEYPPKTGNIWVVAHMRGPYLLVPVEAPRGKRVLFKDIIAVDSSGRKYRQPDRYYISGIWVPKDPPKK